MRIESILVGEDLWEYVEGTTKCPEAKDPAKPTETETAEIAEWKKKDHKARSVVIQHISDSEMKHIIGRKTAIDVWTSLKLVKESTSTRTILDMRRRLYHSLAEESADIAEHVSQMRQYHDELTMMGQKIDDQEFFYCLAASLPSSWDTFTTIYITANDTGMSVSAAKFISAVYEEIRRRTARTETDTALRAASVPRGTRQNTSNGEGCSNCGKKNHRFEDCWSKGGGKEGQGPKQRRKKKKENGTANKAEDAPASEVNLAYMAYNVVVPSEDSSDSWWLDSCASNHMCVNKSLFTSYKLENQEMKGIGGSLAVRGIGTVIVKFKVGDKITRLTLRNVRHTPDFNCNLISLARLAEEGTTFEGGKGIMRLVDKDHQVVGIGRVKRGMYMADAIGEIAPQPTAMMVNTEALSWDEWHRRYGHLAYSSINTLQKKNMVSGLIIDEGTKPAEHCEVCTKAKMTRKSFPHESNEKTDRAGDLTLSDVWGPSRIESIAKSRYYISFTDHHTRHVAVFFLKKKDEAYDRITEYLTYVETQKGYIPKAIRFDNGKELVNNQLKAWCAKKGIIVQTTAPYSPSQNGIAERLNRTLLELARAMLMAKDLPAFLWTEAVSHAAYLRNHAPTRALDGKTPEEVWTGKKPDVSHLREFGSEVWIRDEGNIGKLDPRANKFIFVGYQDGARAVRYYDRAKRSIKVSRNFIFGDEEVVKSPEGCVIKIEGERKEDSNQQNASRGEETREMAKETHQTPKYPPNENTTSTSRPGNPPNSGIREHHSRSSKRPTDYNKLGNPDVRTTSKRYQEELDKGQKRQLSPESEDGQDDNEDPLASYFVHTAYMASNGHHTPKTLREAAKSSEWNEWNAAMGEEMDQLTKMQTWELVEPPVGRKVIGCRWVYAKKYNEDGQVTKHKARLVAQGFSQIPGIDYTDNYSPVVRLDAIRTCVALSAVKGWTMRQLDIKGAYLNGVLDEEIYMRQPEGFDDGSSRVCKLRLSIYGLKQAGRVWNKTLHATLTNLGFNRIDADPCVYKLATSNKTTILTVWVDDIILCGNSTSDIDKTVKALGQIFEVKDLGEPKLLLGIQIIHDKTANTITLSQTNYINTILERFDYRKLNPVSSPLDPNVILRKREDDDLASAEEIHDYQMKLGSVMYAAIATMPQLAYAVQTLSQFSSNPAPEHHTALKRVFRYLVKARDEKWGLTYGGQLESPDELVGYSDADWGSNPNDRKSISGYVFLLGGGAISWSSKKQTSVALSSCEAEYMAACYATRHTIWLRRLLSDLTTLASHPTTLFMDNEAALTLSKDVMFHQRTKHIDIQYHFVRNCVLNGTLATHYCPTQDNIMTKALRPIPHHKFTEEMGILPA
ncbi:hypothetical protein FRC15_010949 [Serendipita sp. 397]|nr:hypothetical protein FRC15_010949 [Serendipita sp. 397]